MFERVLICYSHSKDPNREFTNKLMNILQIRYDIDDIVINKIEDNLPIDGKFDIAFSVGGDGTMLRTIHLVDDVPIIGVNLGRKGFITNIEPLDINVALNNVFSGRYSVNYTSFIEGYTNGEIGWAVNDITIGKKDFLKTVHLELYVDNKFVGSYICDGMLVSTAFGSTAYNRALNNTIVHPNSPVYIITPIGTADASFKSLIVHHDSNIKIKVLDNSASSDIVVGFDGTQKVLDLKDNEIEIYRSSASFKTVELYGYDYFENLRNKI